MRSLRSLPKALTILALAWAAPAAAELPPLTAADWAATAPADDPRASMLVLFERAEMQLRDLTRQQASSSMRLEQRIKVLTPEGLHGGEFEFAHSRWLRLKSLTGRTVLPGGRVVPLPADAKFERRRSQRRRSWVTAVAFPGVEVGAIVEVEAHLYFDSFVSMEPWLLSETVPVVHSEVVYDIPNNIQFGTWGRDPFSAGVEVDKSQGPRGFRIRAWADDLPAVPAEPWSPPFADLATQFGVITSAYRVSDTLIRLTDSWPSACAWIDEQYYMEARRGDRGVAQRARELVAKLHDPREKAVTLYRFVRDEVRNEDAAGVWLEEGARLADVLAEGAGDSAEKALLLQSMLDAAGIRSRLVWANERSTGLPVMEVPSPAWFERVLVAVDLSGLPEGRAFLDPSTPDLPFGVLPYELEGGQAVLFDVKKPEVVRLPSLAVEANGRDATLKLAVDDEGRLAGTGELRLSGQHGLLALAKGDPAKRQETWQSWLGENLPGFKVDAVEVATPPDAGELVLTWRMTQRDEEVLGDEVTLSPSRPLGPVTQALTLPPAARRTPVVLPFGDRDEVTLELSFPAGWKVESLPSGIQADGPAGLLQATVVVDDAQHRLRYHRRLDVRQREDPTREGYVRLRDFYALAEKQDAQVLGLARR
jgi:transglutaminase-like putative cysteine protease